MKKNINRLILTILLFSFCQISIAQDKKFVMVIHGGAGDLSKENISQEKEKAYTEKLNEALTLGERMLKEGSKGIDVVLRLYK